MELIHQILKIAEEREVNDKQLANIAGVNTSNISHWRSPEGSRPSSKVIDKLLDHFGLQLQVNRAQQASQSFIKDVNDHHKFGFSYLVSKHTAGEVRNITLPSGLWPTPVLGFPGVEEKRTYLNLVTDSSTTSILRNIKVVVEPMINLGQEMEVYTAFIEALKRGTLVLKKEGGYPITINIPLKNKIVTVSYGNGISFPNDVMRAIPISTYPAHKLNYDATKLDYEIDLPEANQYTREGLASRFKERIIVNPASTFKVDMELDTKDISKLQSMVGDENFMAVRLTIILSTRDYTSLGAVKGLAAPVDPNQIPLRSNNTKIDALTSYENKAKSTFLWAYKGYYDCGEGPEGFYIKGDLNEIEEVKSMALKLNPMKIKPKGMEISPFEPFKDAYAAKVWDSLLEATYFLSSSVTLHTVPFPTVLESHIDFPVVGSKDILVTPTNCQKQLNPPILLPRDSAHLVALTVPVPNNIEIDKDSKRKGVQEGQLEIDIINHVLK